MALQVLGTFRVLEGSKLPRNEMLGPLLLCIIADPAGSIALSQKESGELETSSSRRATPPSVLIKACSGKYVSIGAKGFQK
jgi:hypothetical protein